MNSKKYWVPIGFFDTTDRALLYAQKSYKNWTGELRRKGTNYFVALI